MIGLGDEEGFERIDRTDEVSFSHVALSERRIFNDWFMCVGNARIWMASAPKRTDRKSVV